MLNYLGLDIVGSIAILRPEVRFKEEKLLEPGKSYNYSRDSPDKGCGFGKDSLCTSKTRSSMERAKSINSTISVSFYSPVSTQFLPIDVLTGTPGVKEACCYNPCMSDL